MKQLKKFEGFLYDNTDLKHSDTSYTVRAIALELVDPLLEPIRDFYELDFVGFSHDKLQMYFNLRLNDESSGKVIVDEKLLKMLKALSAKLKEYGLKVLIENKSLFRTVDVDVDTLVKDKVYKTGCLLIRDENYREIRTQKTG